MSSSGLHNRNFVTNSMQYIKKIKTAGIGGINLLNPGSPHFLQFNLRSVISPKCDFRISTLKIILVYRLLGRCEIMILNVNSWHTVDDPKMTEVAAVLVISRNSRGSNNSDNSH